MLQQICGEKQESVSRPGERLAATGHHTVIKVINVEGHSTVLALLELHPETPVSDEVSVPSESLHDEDRTQNPEELEMFGKVEEKRKT